MSPGEQPAPVKSFIGGAISGVLTALVMAGLLLSVLFQDQLSSLFIVVLIVIVVLGPLLLVNLGISAAYARRNAPASAFFWIWGPPGSIVVIIGLISSFHDVENWGFEKRHPSIQEVHINLSGHSLWLDPETAAESRYGAEELPGSQPEAFVPIFRWNSSGPEKMRAYDGSRLAEDFKSIRVFLGKPEQTQPTYLPVSVTASYPDLGRFMHRYEIFNAGEASRLLYLYYYYADHVEVVPALRFSGLDEQDLLGRETPVIAFHLAHLGTLPLARLEIDGQAVYLGDRAFASEPPDASDCARRNWPKYVINDLNHPLRVRWQFAQPEPRWHEALVRVPEFRSTKRPSGRVHPTRVDLYFQNGDSVVAERSLEIDLGQEKRALLTTGPGEPLPRPAPCGTAADLFYGDVDIIRD